MQCEEDWLVMYVLDTKQGWSIEAIAEEFGVNRRTAKRYATSDTVCRYSPRSHPTAFTNAELARVVRSRSGRL